MGNVHYVDNWGCRLISQMIVPNDLEVGKLDEALEPFVLDVHFLTTNEADIKKESSKI